MTPTLPRTIECGILIENHSILLKILLYLTSFTLSELIVDFQIGLPEDGGQMLLRHLHTQHREHRHRRLPPGKHARQVKSSQLSHVKKGQGK